MCTRCCTDGQALLVKPMLARGMGTQHLTHSDMADGEKQARLSAAHICAGTGLTPAHICSGTGLKPRHICAGTLAPIRASVTAGTHTFRCVGPCSARRRRR